MSATGHTHRGKWSEAGVPKKGWTCTSIDDLGAPSQDCEMCEAVEIRYVHYMEHPNYPDVLTVGCVCAEHMEEDYVRPKEREKRLRRAASRRHTWAKKQWRFSEKGSLYLNTEGYNLTVFKKGTEWGVRVANRANQKTQVGKKSYPDQEAAKSSALYALLWAKEHLS